ncbi:response regulator [Rhodobacter ferrooxidans]|uniref:Response regulator receiver protein n=1 Tax=Rhodobacter ferrooxidans TaxID=371731 RepID=C8S4D0_9RHOB|nr:response regulator [Rhodobacter sp. SW2]EEW24189.1 response regulator receiver protein [Rhodobacter sp. SW2]
MTIKVLAIDDSRTIRSLVQKVMEEAGFECALADDGVQGVARFVENPPDVVITDINMPNMDGYGVIAAIRGGSVHRNVPILVLTTESAPHLKARARDAGATGWIVKPFDDVAIVSVVRRVTGARA